MKYKCLEKFSKDNKKKSHKFIQVINKMLVGVLIGLICLIVMEYSPKAKKYINENILNENFSFGFIGKLYNKYFGEVLPNDNEKVVSVFNEKLVYNKKEKYHDGYSLEVSKNYLVPVIDNGIVVFIGKSDDYGNIITIEQENNIKVTYGNITTNNVKLYDYVKKGSFLGESLDENIYIVMEKNGEYLDIETYLS